MEPTFSYIETVGADASVLAIQALAPVRTKEAITPVAAMLQLESIPQPLIDAALATLLSQTGREDLGDDPQAWIAWWEEARWLPPREWEAMQAASHAERARRLQRDSDQQMVRIIELYRRMYALTPQEERSALLASMMEDPEGKVRRLAFELAERALLNAERLDVAITQATIDRLTDPLASVRSAAAGLLNRLGVDEQVSFAIRSAIRTESDPTVAGAMLTILGRRPQTEDIPICLEWLGRAEPASSSAARTLASCASDGLLTKPRHRTQALASLRATDSRSLTPGKIALLGVLGSFADRDRLAFLLTEGIDPTLRRAAAIAMVPWPESIGVLTRAVRLDAAILSNLTDAVLLHEANSQGYQIIAEIEGVAPESRGTQLNRVRRAIPPAEVLGSMSPEESVPAKRADLLTQILDLPNVRDLSRIDPRFVLTQTLINDRFDLGEDAQVVDLMARIDQGQVWINPETRSRWRLSLLVLGRFDDADEAGADESDYRAALKRSEEAGSDTATGIAEAIAARFPAESPADDAEAAERVIANDDDAKSPAAGDGSELPEGQLSDVPALLEPEGSDQ